MVALVVVNWTDTPYLRLAFRDGRTPLELVAERVDLIRSALAESTAEQVVLVRGLVVSNASARVATPLDEAIEVDLAGCSGAAVLKRIHDALPEEVQDIVLVAGDGPFVDPLTSSYLFELQRRSWSDYTFADGFPEGFAPEVVRRDALPALAALAEAGGLPPSRALVFEALSRDVNAFDVETEAAADDLAVIRMPLTVETRASYLYCRRLYEAGLSGGPPQVGSTPDPYRQRLDAGNHPLLTAVRDRPDLRRTVPGYVQVQITTAMSQTPSYTPWILPDYAPPAAPPEHMPLDRWRALLGEVSALSPEAVVAIGYRGEPALHPDIVELILAMEEYAPARLYVETSGIGWTDRAREALARPVVAALIVELDAERPDTYRHMRGDGQAEATRFVEEMARRMPNRVYAQATRTRTNEWELQPFFNRWRAHEGVTPLIQKFNSFVGRVDDLSVSDLSPLERHPCWHLQRDLVVLVDGTVVRCFQDLDREAVRGRCGDESLEELWRRGDTDFERHVARDYPSLCVRCDEYFTFNA